MSVVKRVAKNTIVLLVAQIVTLVSGYLFLMYTAQYLGPKNFGILSFALAFASIFGLISDMGLSQLITREIARDYSITERYIGNIVLIKVLLSCITLSIILLVAYFLTGNQKSVVFLIGISILIENLNKMFYSIFQAFEKLEFQSIGQIIYCIALLAGALIAIYFNSDVVVFALLYVIANFITLVYSSLIATWKFVTPRIKYEFMLWRNLLKESIPFAITGISISVFLWIDTLMLSFMKGDEVVGWYNAAYKLVLVLRFIPFVLTYSIFPLMSKYSLTSKDYLMISFEKMLKLLVFIALPLGFGTLFVADKIILEVYGVAYSNSIIILQILIWSSVLVFIRIPYERLMESVNRQALVTKMFMIGAAFNVIVNLFLIPVFSYIGAAFATLMTDLMLLILLVIYSKKLGYGMLNKQYIYIAKIILSCITMGLVLEFSPTYGLFVQIIIAAFVFTLTSLFLGTFGEEERKMVLSIFK